MNKRLVLQLRDIFGGEKDIPRELEPLLRSVSETYDRFDKAAKPDADTAKSEFLSRISHEMRTPLHAIIGFAEYITLISNQPEVVRRASIIMHESESFLRLINDILDQAKMEAGTFDLVARPFTLSGVARDLETIMRPLAEAKGLRLDVSAAEGLPPQVIGDAYRVRQILVNLVGNAVKFTEKGFVALEITAERSGPDQYRARFRISDSGIGMDADKMKNLFTPFYQADSNLDRKYEGTGLGTYIVKRLVEQMGGTLGCSSQPGKGSIFWCEIPFTTKLAQEASAAARDGAAAAPAEIPVPAENLRILYAEDQEVNRDLARAQLQQLGLKNLVLVENGEEAVAACEKTEFDLVFLDLQMPVMDGVIAAANIRLKHPRLPLIAITANVNPAVHRECLETGFAEVLLKPTKVGALAALIGRYGHVNLPAAQAARPQAAPTTNSASPALDAALGLELFGGNAMLYRMALSKFRGDLELFLPALDQQLRGGDFATLGKTAHKLAGSAAAVGAPGLSAAARQLEDAARSGDGAACAAHAAEITRIAPLVVAAMDA
ncbi:MAG: response regulator [Elusimicrobia bacterium]|nr:response regulator [Elusimicrobiota bacterium]